MKSQFDQIQQILDLQNNNKINKAKLFVFIFLKKDFVVKEILVNLYMMNKTKINKYKIKIKTNNKNNKKQ